MSIAGNKERDLTTGPLVPKIILFALPLMATGILQLMFNAADLIIVGQFAPNGQEDIGAIGGTGPLINLVIICSSDCRWVHRCLPPAISVPETGKKPVRRCIHRWLWR